MTRLLGVLLVVIFLLPVSGEAARLFTNGFEENDLAATAWNSVGAGFSVVTTTPHSGTYRGQVTGTSGKSIRRDIATAMGEGTTLFVRVYWQTNSLSGNSSFLAAKSNGGSGAWDVQKLSTGKVRLTNSPTAETVDSTFTLSTNTDYRFEVRQIISDTVGEVELKIFVGDSTTPSDDIQIGAANKDTMPTNVGQFFLQETAASGSLTYLFDDVGLNDATGAFQNTWLGPGKIALITPSGDNTVAWTKAGSAPAATNWDGVNEVPGTPDDGTTYNAFTTQNTEDRLDLTDLPAEVPSTAVMVLIDVAGRVSSDGGSGTLAFKIWDDGGTGTQGSTMTVNSATWRINTTNEHQVANLSGKTKTNTNAYTAGYRTVSNTVEKRVSALFANVEWIEAAASADFFQRRIVQ